MIRRIIESLRSRNFSLLVFELFVVIVGVYIGIQVSNWNDTRLDRIRSYEYLDRIGADLEADIANYRDRLGFWESVSTYGTNALAYAESGDMAGLSKWDLVLAFFQASQLAEFYTTRSTYEELKSGGELGLIRDLNLRNLLGRYYTSADNAVLSERPAYREHVRGLIPLHVQNYIWEECYWSNGENQKLLDCESPIDADEATRIVDLISSNQQLMFELQYWMSTMRVARLMGGDRVILAERIRSIVLESMNGRVTL